MYEDTGYQTSKRFLDFWMAIVGLILALPLILIVAVLIKLESAGPVLFFQSRVGRNERLFVMIKLRTMVDTADPQCDRFAEVRDRRVTRLGSILRKYRIDELPQLINVIVGDMSIVGPRPEQPKFFKYFSLHIPSYAKRCMVKPGITGLAQIRCGYADDIETTKVKLAHDLEYVQRSSIRLDLWILMKTVSVALTGFGAR